MSEKQIFEDLNIDGDVKSDNFIRKNGTASQFLKADGSIDDNTYLTAGSGSGISETLAIAYSIALG
jgi:hypothetical protein